MKYLRTPDFQTVNSIDLVVLNLFGEFSPVLGVLTVPQAGGVVPGPHLARPDASQDKTQQHHHALPLLSHLTQITLLSQSK